MTLNAKYILLKEIEYGAKFVILKQLFKVEVGFSFDCGINPVGNLVTSLK